MAERIRAKRREMKAAIYTATAGADLKILQTILGENITPAQVEKLRKWKHFDYDPAKPL